MAEWLTNDMTWDEITEAQLREYILGKFGTDAGARNTAKYADKAGMIRWLEGKGSWAANAYQVARWLRGNIAQPDPDIVDNDFYDPLKIDKPWAQYTDGERSYYHHLVETGKYQLAGYRGWTGQQPIADFLGDAPGDTAEMPDEFADGGGDGEFVEDPDRTTPVGEDGTPTGGSGGETDPDPDPDGIDDGSTAGGDGLGSAGGGGGGGGAGSGASGGLAGSGSVGEAVRQVPTWAVLGVGGLALWWAFGRSGKGAS